MNRPHAGPNPGPLASTSARASRQGTDASPHPAEFRILLVEDDADDATMVRSVLAEQDDPRFTVTWCPTLAAALQHLDTEPVDAVLLDLSLPDCAGMDSLRQIAARHGATPVVVLTGQTDAGDGLKALSLGAEDYLLKSELVWNLLARSLRYARERRALHCELETLREHERLEHEQAAFARLLSRSHTPVTAQLYGAIELAEASPDLFAELVHRYAELLGTHLNQQPRPGEKHATRDLRTMSDSLGLVGAGPRDVIRIHQDALRQCTSTVNDTTARAMGNESRLMLIELMGYVLAWYRCQATGIDIHATAPAHPESSASEKEE